MRTGRLDRACLIGGTTSRTTRTSTKLEYWTRQLPACAKRWGANGLSHDKMCVVAMRAMSAMAQDAPRHEACWQTEPAATFMATARAPNNGQSDEREVHVAEECPSSLNSRARRRIASGLVSRAPQSAPLRRIGTFSLAVGAACAFSLGITGQVLTFRTRARLSFAPPTCRMPLGPSQASPKLIPEAGSAPGFDIV